MLCAACLAISAARVTGFPQATRSGMSVAPQDKVLMVLFCNYYILLSILFRFSCRLRHRRCFLSCCLCNGYSVLQNMRKYCNVDFLAVKVCTIRKKVVPLHAFSRFAFLSRIRTRGFVCRVVKFWGGCGK